MRELAIRGFDDELADRIRQLAGREGISLNRAVPRLLRRGAGLGESNDEPEVVGDSLDHLIGTWTAEEAAEIERALEDFSRIDGEMWRAFSARAPARGACVRPIA